MVLKKGGKETLGVMNADTQSFTELMKKLKTSTDFTSFQLSKSYPFSLSYYKTLVKQELIHRDILPVLVNKTFQTLEDIKKNLPIENMLITSNLKEIQEGLLSGSLMISINQQFQNCVLLIPAVPNEGRQVTIPEVESGIIGPKEAFIESLDTNISLVRKRIPLVELNVKEVKVGNISKTKVAILYIAGIANSEYVNTALQRINDIEYDQIIDSSYISQMITDNPNSLFPQIFDTERPDRVASLLSEGKIAVLVDGSPHALIIPVNIFEFFSSFDDYFFNWQAASFFRLMRLMAVLLSTLMTPIYVAVLTYHYEMIPDELLISLVSSRKEVPFPPIIEVLILEFAIALLREAAKRLPTKIGQTMGIVGGIVIGTASVEAAITSNVLIIIVALAALAAFTIPAFQMSNTVILIRLPMLISAQILGLFGMSICTAFFLGHLLRVTSLGCPYLEPIYPVRSQDMKDALYRLPFHRQTTRPIFLRTGNPTRMITERVKEKHDIDE
ncbi:MULTISPECIES: spore germination protein [Bacillaceae]|uniref:spore germination protein n=1 Tax=Bacillaceae TaxID=186817 RepID=UPI001FE6038B|nr:spore germination protein [Ectobacillus funiculus]